MSRTVLLLATTTGYQTQAFADAARRLEATVVLGTDRCHRLEDPWRDGALALHFQDPEKAAEVIAEYAVERTIDAVVCVGDAPVMTAALACRRLGLRHHSPPGAAASRNKYRGRLVLRDAGMLVPHFVCLSAHDPGQASDPPAGLRFPCVLKPVTLSGSRGVIRADNPQELHAAFHRIAAILTSRDAQVKKEEGLILVEDFIEGPEFALEGLMDRGRLFPLALFDKPDPLNGPYFEETIYVTPSRLSRDAQQAITDAIEQACKAMGLEHGPVHAEVRYNERGVWILEVAGRPIGGLCARALRFRGGVGLEELIVRHALGLPFDWRREEGASGVMMIPIPREGLLQEVKGLDEARSVPGIEDITITAKAGEHLVPWPEGSSYLGFIFARAGQPAGTEEALRKAHAKLNFVIAPSLPVL